MEGNRGLTRMKNLVFAPRKFTNSKYHEAFESNKNNSTTSKTSEVPKKDLLLDFVRKSIIGAHQTIPGPFGERRISYCDYTASSRALSFIEDFIREQVLPYYANTHSNSSFNAKQTTFYREESRMLIKRMVNANFSKGSDKDVLIFVGSGSTSAIHKIIQVLDLLRPDKEDQSLPKATVFIGPFEHHSNILPWREACVELVQIGKDKEGNIDIEELEKRLQEHQERNQNLANSRLLIGSFSAASNITGILADTESISILLHRYGALAFWDYASAGPYVKIDMNPVHNDPSTGKLAYKDAIFLSPHKFIGGVETPGILVAKKKLFRNRETSSQPGGGTVFFVTSSEHRYVKEVEPREEGGTPDIVGSIRAGLVFQLKNNIGEDFIETKERSFVNRALARWQQNPHVRILGSTTVSRLAIVSFVIARFDKLLHYNFVATLLNDLFGIQSRGGCACAGPYAQSLLGINLGLARQFEQCLVEDDDNELLRPGFVRISFAYFLSELEFEYILSAVEFVANEGWKLLPLYTFYPDTAQWVHKQYKKEGYRRWIGQISYSSSRFEFNPPNQGSSSIQEEESCFDEYLQAAKAIVFRCSEEFRTPTEQDHLVPEKYRHLNWMLLPSQARALLQQHQNLEESSALPFVTMSQLYSTISKGSEVTDNQPRLPQEEPEQHEQNCKSCSNGSCNKIQIQTNAEENLTAKQIAIEEDLTNDNLADETSDLVHTPSPSKKTKNTLFPDLPKKEVITPTKKAIFEFGMIKEGDRLLLGLSGGKDSMTMLHTLLYFKRSMAINFDVGACTIDPQTEAYDPAPLIGYMKTLGVPYFFESQPLIERAKDSCTTSICSWCSRMKRGALYACARREGYNVLVLAQHMDDLAESFLMSAFHNGFLRTMKANYVIDEGDLRVIRPFIYVRERNLRDWAITNQIPVISENCPACFEAPKERRRIKTLLATQEHLYPNLFYHLLSTMKPLLSGEFTPKIKGSSKSKGKTRTRQDNSANKNNNNHDNSNNNLNQDTHNHLLSQFSTDELLREIERRKQLNGVT